MGPWAIALVGVLIVAAGFAIPIKGPGGIGNSRDGDPAPHRSVPAIVAGFAVVAVGVVLAWQPWGKDGSSPSAADGSPAAAVRSASGSPSGAAATPQNTPTADAPTPTDPTDPTSDSAGSADPGTDTSSSAPATKLWKKNLDFTFPGTPYGGSYLDLSKPASGTNVAAADGALEYANGYNVVPGDHGDVFGYTATEPTDATDCVQQAQEHAVTKLETVTSPFPSNDPLVKTGDSFCVSDKAGNVAWLKYVGATPHDGTGGMPLHFKMTLWKAVPQA